MQAVGPYTLITAGNTCQVGSAWSGVDETGLPVTVAVLNERASADQRWRDAFAATATALSQAQVDRLPLVAADFQAEFPWVACSLERGPGAAQIFLALGQSLQSAAPDGPSPAEPTPPAAGDRPAGELELLNAPTTAQPTLGPRLVPVQWRTPDPAVGQYAAEPASAATATDATPTSSATALSSASTTPAALAAGPLTSEELPAPAPTFPAGRPLVLRQPAERQRRPGLALVLVAVSALVLGGVAGAGGAVALRPDPTPARTVASTAQPLKPTAKPLDPALPTEPPKQPGLEPPEGGGWPDWPTFSDSDRTRGMSNLTGLGFSFEVPEDWDCVRTGRTSGFVRYRCGVHEGDGVSVGGDLVVRVCERPCTERRRTQMRELEEAWALRWIRSGPFTTWAQSWPVEDGRYGLVYLSYWRSNRADAIDRQLVLRMTAPPDERDVLRKVANSIREATFTI